MPGPRRGHWGDWGISLFAPRFFVVGYLLLGAPAGAPVGVPKSAPERNTKLSPILLIPEFILLYVPKLSKYISAETLAF